ncbi:hypothetical protein [Rubritalea tangerina]|uniref:hypothetical protein n=1 Tax=Rubritalea tangerina TaxID=430798 RepID=UPI003612F16F
MSSMLFSCPARTGGLHWALIFCKLIPTIRPFRFAQWYYGRWHWKRGETKNGLSVVD